MIGRLRPSVCIDAVLGGLSPQDALKVVSEAGINAFEFWGWWEKDLDAIDAAAQRHGLEIKIERVEHPTTRVHIDSDRGNRWASHMRSFLVNQTMSLHVSLLAVILPVATDSGKRGRHSEC